MNVQCPVCRAVYRIDPGRIPPGGVRAGCARCDAAFLIGAARGAITTAAAAAPGAAVVAGSGDRGLAAGMAEASAGPGSPSAARGSPGPPRPGAVPPAADRRAAEAPPVASGSLERSERDAPERAGANVEGAGVRSAPQAPSAPGPTAPPPPPPAPPVAASAASGVAAAGSREGRFPLPGAGAAYAAGGGGSPQAGVARPTSPSRPSPFGVQDPNARARRIARALVSDIVAYNRARRDRSLAEGTIRGDFREEIMKSWNEYVEQVGEELARSTPYFRESLNEILAQGREVF
jgi:predicted Zn finger-like uncharacterized protein